MSSCKPSPSLSPKKFNGNNLSQYGSLPTSHRLQLPHEAKLKITASPGFT